MIQKLLCDKKIDFMQKKKIAILISFLFCILTVIAFITKGVTLGIDFAGGTVIEIRSKNNIDIANLRNELNNNFTNSFSLQYLEDNKNMVVKTDIKDDNSKLVQVKSLIKQNITDVEYRRIDSVGSNISSEMLEYGILALLLSFILISLYIWLRFTINFSIGAVLALLHDILLTMGFIIVCGIELNLPVIAGILTIIGYSINDSVVIFDRIRSNMVKYSNRNILDIVNMSINQTLSRTILTAVTTIISIIALISIGGETMTNFGLVILFGIIIGTYSSIFNCIIQPTRHDSRTV